MITHALVIAQRHLLHLIRSPDMLIFSLVQPIMFLLLFNYVFGGAIEAALPGSYIDFIVPGITVQMVAFTSFNTGVGLNTDRSQGIVDRFRSLPISRLAVLAGRVLSDAVNIVLLIVVIVVTGAAMGFRAPASALPAVGAFALAAAFGIALTWVGAWIGLSVRSTEAVQSAGFIWLFPMTFASSAFAPAASMPGWLQAFVSVNPVTIVVDALRALLTGQPAAALVAASVAWIAGITAVFAPLAASRYHQRA